MPTTGQIAFDCTEYQLVECRRCELVFLSPGPSKRDLDRIYLESTQFTHELYTDPQRVASILEYMSSCLERMLRRRGSGATVPVASLEIGAGLAWLSRAVKARNPSSRTTAQDISSEAARQCPWVDRYIEGEVFDARLDELGPYDVISLTHVIEHLPDPVSVVHRCKALLARDGLILVTAPHRPVGWSRGSRDISLWTSYSYNHVPAHIQYFSDKSMRAFARKAGCRLVHWDARSEAGQAFEAWLS